MLTYGEIHEFLGGEIDVAAWDTSRRASDAGR
jgi:hypothetical protein